MTTDERIREVIRNTMQQHNLSQAELARRLGIKSSSMAQILSGKYGKIPQSLIDVLNALDLELTVQSKPNERN